MIAFHGSATIKATYLKRVRQHAKLDQIIHGTYWENGKGCAVGCTIHGSEHAKYETELGIPRILARLEDRIFEGMANGFAKQWPAQFLAAIRVGADLSLVWPRFAVWLLVDKRTGVIRHAKNDGQRAAIQRVADLYGKVIKGEPVAESDWRAAADAADAAYAAAAAYAAYAAASSASSSDAAYAAYAAYAAAAATTFAAPADAAYAAYAAYAAAAATTFAAPAAAARSKSFERMAKKLLALLKSAPIPRKAKAA